MKVQAMWKKKVAHLHPCPPFPKHQSVKRIRLFRIFGFRLRLPFTNPFIHEHYHQELKSFDQEKELGLIEKENCLDETVVPLIDQGLKD